MFFHLSASCLESDNLLPMTLTPHKLTLSPDKPLRCVTIFEDVLEISKFNKFRLQMGGGGWKSNCATVIHTSVGTQPAEWWKVNYFITPSQKNHVTETLWNCSVSEHRDWGREPLLIFKTTGIGRTEMVMENDQFFLLANPLTVGTERVASR